jgi:restriction system protein
MLDEMMRALQDQWKKPLPAGYVRNTSVLENLLAALRDGASIVELIGSYGTGKTTLLRALEHESPSLFDGTVEYFVGSPSFPLVDAFDLLAERFRASKGRNLLIVDEAERVDKGDLLEAINRLGTGPWHFSTILATTVPLDIGRATSRH